MVSSCFKIGFEDFDVYIVVDNLLISFDKGFINWNLGFTINNCLVIVEVNEGLKDNIFNFIR